MSSTFNITDQNWREEVHQNAIRLATYAVLNRLERAQNIVRRIIF